MTPEQIIEHEANEFAMELLMPRAWLLADLKKLRGIDIENDSNVHALARKYGVSDQVMTFRIAQIWRGRS